MIPFAKGHGLGNDYIVLEQKSLTGPLTTAAIRRICDRNWGVGSDGILLLTPTSRADFGFRIFNPDGSEAEKSVNLRRAQRLVGHRQDPLPLLAGAFGDQLLDPEAIAPDPGR